MNWDAISAYLLLNMDFITKLLLVLAYSFFGTLVATPYVFKQLRKRGYTGEDMYKHSNRIIPSMGGLAAFIGLILSLSLSVILFDKSMMGDVFIFYFVITIYMMYGVLDDLFHFEARYDKIIVLAVLSLPLSILIDSTSINFFGFDLFLGSFYSLLIVPIYVMVVANMVNIHAGFNGLTVGSSLLVIITTIIKSVMDYGLTSKLLFIAPILGGLIVLWHFNKYPAKCFPGNCGDFMIGSVVGAYLMINNYFWFGIVILIPHIINFMMDTVTMIVKKHPKEKFGTVREDGTVKPPKVIINKSIIYWLTGNFRMTEKSATNICLAFTAVCCVLGLILF